MDWVRVSVCTIVLLAGSLSRAVELRLASFNVDVTPPIGSPLCGGAVEPAQSVENPLSARGVVLFPSDQQPIVLCAVDCVGIANSAHDAWKQALAEAVQTTPDRVTVHALHQHDAPFADFDTEDLLAPLGLGGKMFDVAFARDCIARAAEAAKTSIAGATPISHVAAGTAEVERVASNRRVLGADGNVRATRWTTTADAGVRAEPEGTLDPRVRVVSFWNGDTPVAALTYYATHPQCNYGEGRVSHDFPGMARALFENEIAGLRAIHFNGAGGNITAGKYNNGDAGNRALLAHRLFEGLREAWTNQKKIPIADAPIEWRTLNTKLPVRSELVQSELEAQLADANADEPLRLRAARELAWLARASSGTLLTALHIGPIVLVHMPGELFVEYQLAAQQMNPAATVCMAAYGDYGPGYIGTTQSYPQGGYETQLYVSRTAPEVEPVLMEALKKLIE